MIFPFFVLLRSFRSRNAMVSLRGRLYTTALSLLFFSFIIALKSIL